MREEEKKTSQDSRFKRFFKKRWVFPSLYIASAAIILTAVLWYQNSNNATDQLDYEETDLAGKEINEQPAIEVNRSMENFSMPVADPDSVVIAKEFYDYDATKEEQEAALVFYNNTYHPNTGVDIAMDNGETFEVIASLSGTVTNVQEDSLLGNVIEIEHDKGIVTQYQSVTDIDVKVGDQVEQGQALAMAGKSLYNEEAGTHVHFEIRKDNVAVNPLDYFNKPLSSLQEASMTEEKDDSGKADSEGTKEEETPADDKKDEGQPAGDKESDKESDKKDENSQDEPTEDEQPSEGEEDANKTDSSNT